MSSYLTGSGAPTHIPSNIGDRYRDTSVDPAIDYEAIAIRADGWKSIAAQTTSEIEDESIVAADLSENIVQRLSVISVGFAALNTAGTGVAALFGTAIPDNAIVLQAFYEVTSTFVDNGTAGDADSATIKLGIEDQDNDLLAAVAISDGANPFDAGIKALIPVDTIASAIKLSTARQLAVTFTAGTGDSTALTAGAMNVFIKWVQGA